MALTLAATHDISVGKGGLRYDPESLTAAQGDTLRFHFYPDEHDVAQSAFDRPCVPLDGGIYSGLVEVEGMGESVSHSGWLCDLLEYWRGW